MVFLVKRVSKEKLYLAHLVIQEMMGCQLQMDLKEILEMLEKVV